jgi:hypothetical protein
MAKREKLLAAIRNNPQAVRFNDACKAAEMVGFTETGGRGSHTVYTKEDTQDILNFQNKDGYIYPYQAYQLIKMLDKYE